MQISIIEVSRPNSKQLGRNASLNHHLNCGGTHLIVVDHKPSLLLESCDHVTLS